MTALTDIDWETSVLTPTRDRDLERFVRRALGIVPPLATYFYDCPWVVRCVVFFDESQFPLVHTPRDLAWLISLVVSQENSCRFCYAASRAVLRLMGFADDRIERLETELFTPTGASIKPALDFARAVSRASLPSARREMEALPRARYAEDAVKEIAFLAGTNVFFNRLATLPALPTDSVERFAGSRLLPLMGPFFRGLQRLHSRRRRVCTEVPDLRGRPYAYLVDAFAGLPIAGALASALFAAWESPILTRRAKALLFAVVARGLGCPISEREAHGLLAAEGLAPGEIEQALDHLACPALDPLEAAIVPLARETVWYRPAHIQRRSRAVLAELTHEQFLELVGIVSLANAVCRMSVVLPTTP